MTKNNVNKAFDFACERGADGFTTEELATLLGVGHQSARNTVHSLRLALADDDVNLPCDLDADGTYRYRLVGTREGTSGWHLNRLRDAETRLSTMQAVASSVTHATDGRTAEGRKARVLDRALTRLIEDLHEIDVTA